MAGVSENILMGQLCPVGTGAFSLLVDEDRLAGAPAACAASGWGAGAAVQGRRRGGRRRCRWPPMAPVVLAVPPTLPCQPANRRPLASSPSDAIELDYALVEDAGWGGVGMTPLHMTPGRSPSHLRASPSALASPGLSPFNDSIMFSPVGDGITFSPGPGGASPGYRRAAAAAGSPPGGSRWAVCARRSPPHHRC